MCIVYLYLYLGVLGVPVLGNEVSFDTEASIGADSGVPIEDCAELVPPETRDENSSLKEVIWYYHIIMKGQLSNKTWLLMQDEVTK